MRVTEKGQVTIPKNVRRHLGIGPGSEVEFSFVSDGAVIRKTEPSEDGRDNNVRELMDHIRKYKGTMNLAGMTGDEFYKMLRD
jgi:AbrB family looped-hinge helix DNA binding protein